MARFFYILFFVCTGAIFLLGPHVLDLLGWRFTDDNGPALTRLHPATYLMFVTTALAYLAFPKKFRRALASWPFVVFLVATLILLVRAIIFAVGGVTGGELTTVLCNFLTPALFYLCARCVPMEDFTKLEAPLRIFLALNSVMALAERAVGFRFIPGFLDKTTDIRAAALVGHPLNGSLLTGLILVYLVTARRSDSPIRNRIPEMLIHALAMFAFGGRAAIVFTPIILILSAILGKRRAAGQANISWAQRALPFSVVVAGLGLIFLPLTFVDQTIDRFTNAGNSTQARNSGVDILMAEKTSDLLLGMEAPDRVALWTIYKTPAGIELAWLSLIQTFGLLCVLPMMVALPWFLYNIAKPLDRSATYIMFLFLVITAGSLSFGVKSLTIIQCMMMMMILSQPKLLSIGQNLFGELGITTRRREGRGEKKALFTKY